ncbi:unnamed protein product [Dibothriocephalus latus]|uniref:Uncharacterized protein n=1 Tax=Dibothriocephalus latus TaxID=60516 RepID=A0A3P6Q2I7_DIBLA|nr:unnamed protein product [Dibothriocephalus latus]
MRRHIQCVEVCTLVAEAQHNTTGPIRLCDSHENHCLEVRRVNETFDDFNQCAFRCDGWTTLENTEEHTTTVCNVDGVCETASFFTKPNENNALDGLKTCFKDCMPPIATDMETVEEEKVQDPNEGKFILISVC